MPFNKVVPTSSRPITSADLHVPATKADVLTCLAIQHKIVTILVPDGTPGKREMLENIRQARTKVMPNAG